MDKNSFIKGVFTELNKTNINYWLNFGSVLGAVRNNGKLIEHDHDIDIGLWNRDYKSAIKICKTLEGKNYRVVYQKGFHICEDLIQIYGDKPYKNNFHIDFYIFKKNNNLAYCRNIHFPTSKIGKYYFLLMKLINKYVNIKFVKSLLLNILKYCYEKIFSTYWFILPLEYFLAA